MTAILERFYRLWLRSPEPISESPRLTTQADIDARPAGWAEGSETTNARMERVTRVGANWRSAK